MSGKPKNTRGTVDMVERFKKELHTLEIQTVAVIDVMIREIDVVKRHLREQRAKIRKEHFVYIPDLSVRARRAIWRALTNREIAPRNPKHLLWEDIAELSRDDLLRAREVGKVTLKEIEDALHKRGLKLSDDIVSGW